MRARFILLLVALPVVTHFVLMKTGFCYPQMRWLSDEELIDGFLDQFRASAIAASDRERLAFADQLQKSRDAFLNVSSDDSRYGFVWETLVELVGGETSMVGINDRVNDPHAYRVDCCGRVIGDDTGEPVFWPVQ